MVCDLLLEESNIQPVSTPVTVCGDIHGQVQTDPNLDSNNTQNQIFCQIIIIVILPLFFKPHLLHYHKFF